MTAPAWFRASPRHAWHFGAGDDSGMRRAPCGVRFTPRSDYSSDDVPDSGRLCVECTRAEIALSSWIMRDASRDVIQFVSANLGAFEAMARVAKLGGEKHGGGFGPGPGQTAEDHAAHASGHIRRDGSAYNVRTGERVWPSRDDETGELDLVHAGTRIVMTLTVLGVK